jgi:diguanylate cyclase (GGDEF)-like protein
MERVNVPFLDSLKDPLAVLSRDGRVLEANSAFIALLGKKKSSIMGMDCREIEPLGSLWNTITAAMVMSEERSERIIFHDRNYEARALPSGSNGEKPHVIVMLKDITSLVALEGEMVKRNRELIIVNTLSGAFIGSENMESIYSDLLERALLITELGMGWIVVLSEGDFVLKALSGLSADLREKVFGDDLRPFYDRISMSPDPMSVIEHADPEMPEALSNEGIQLFCSVPLRAGGKIAGLLLMACRRDKAFDFDFASLLSLLGNHLSLISEKVNLFQETRRLSVTDTLTGLYNSRFYFRIIENEAERTKRFGHPFSVAIFDVDDFRKINKSIGHEAGDDVLRSIGQILGMYSRRVDIVARYAGEEFAVMLPNTTREEALACAQRMLDCVAMAKDLPVQIRLSGGIATFPNDADSPGALLHAAEIALEHAKKTGKNRATLYSNDMNINET